MYNLEVFTDQFQYVAFDFVDERQTVDLDYLAFNSYTITTRLMDAKKGYFVRLTRDNEHVASGYIADVQPGKTTQDIQIKPLQTLFDAEVFYTPVTDCITWLATNIQAEFMSNTDTLQNRPITLTYTTSDDALPLTGFNLHATVNILSVIMSALKTYGVVCDMSLDVINKHILVDISQQTATQTIEANLENVLAKSVTLGDSYGSNNKMIIRKIDKDTGDNLGDSVYYLHPNGDIDKTNSNRIYPVFWVLETLETEEDETAADWLARALTRAKEVLQPAKYDNEIILTYQADDMLTHPLTAKIGTNTTIYLDGNTYSSILTEKKITGKTVALVYGVVRQDLTKKTAIRQRETVTYENTVNAVISQVREDYTEKTYLNKYLVIGNQTSGINVLDHLNNDARIAKLEITGSSVILRQYSGGSQISAADLLTAGSFAPVELLSETAIPATATSYSCNWNSYEWLYFVAGNNYNASGLMIMHNAEFALTTSSRRIFLYDLQQNVYYQVYANGNNAVYLRCSATGSSTQRVRIFGILSTT